MQKPMPSEWKEPFLKAIDWKHFNKWMKQEKGANENENITIAKPTRS